MENKPYKKYRGRGGGGHHRGRGRGGRGRGRGGGGGGAPRDDNGEPIWMKFKNRQIARSKGETKVIDFPLATYNQQATYRQILSDNEAARKAELKYDIEEFDSFADVKLKHSKNTQHTNNYDTFGNLERRGLVTYGLRVDLTNKLNYSSAGNVKLRLWRNIDQYGPMVTKGFKVGREYGLCLHDINSSGTGLGNSRINTKLTDHTKCLITYVDTQSVVIELRNEREIVPRFVHEIITGNDRHAELYLAQDIKNLQRHDDLMEQLRVEQRKPLKLINQNGALGFIFDQWLQSTEQSNDAVVRQNVVLFNEKIRSELTMMNAMYESLAMIDDQTSKPLTIIHGPPGTGKTTVTAEIILQVHKLKPDWTILVMAPSHAATDNILASMSKWIEDKSTFYRHGDQSKLTDAYVKEHHTVELNSEPSSAGHSGQ